MQPKLFKIAIVATILITAADHAALAADWVLKHEVTGPSCSIQLADSAPSQGNILARNADSTELCKTAQSLETDDVADSGKCSLFTPNTIAFCKKRGVDLDK